MPSQPRVLGLVVALTLLVSGGVLATGQYYRLSGYESTTATMERAQVQPQYTDGFDPGQANATTDQGAQQPEFGLRNVVYRPNVTYNYTVDGERYTGENVAAGTDIATDNRSDAAALLPARRAGATTTVYYDPEDPDDAHLLHRYRFFPGGLLLVAGLLVLTDTLTPNLRFVRFLTDKIPFATLERVPGVKRTALSEFSDDPTAILDSLDRWEGTEPAPIRSSASSAVWMLCYLFIADLAIVYFALSSRPYDLWAMVPFFAVATGVMRLGFRRLDP
ncbi:MULTISPECIES: DUF3592 domain-containing protein [Haloarcula]|uniref:DUF3592 domain-containing protein n=1 Tax=Haloarcula TaxID=2237 RepID=UPI0023E8C90C|nr:DUF3592 domain-containing protein [Halomicroarcula sp. SHR3]